MPLFRSWCGLPDDFRKLDSYLYYISQLIHRGGYDGSLHGAGSGTVGGGRPSQLWPLQLCSCYCEYMFKFRF